MITQGKYIGMIPWVNEKKDGSKKKGYAFSNAKPPKPASRDVPGVGAYNAQKV